MQSAVRLDALIPTDGTQASRLRIFALIHLGIIESLSNGSLESPEAVSEHFNAANCLFVRKVLRDRLADRIMGHGVQLADLFDVLPVHEAQREYLHELSLMKSFCLELVEGSRPTAEASPTPQPSKKRSRRATAGPGAS